MEVLRLNGAQRVGGKDVVEAIPDAVLVTPAPSLVLCLLCIAMQLPIDIWQIVGAQLTQDPKLEFMLTRIFERIVPVSLQVAPGDDLSARSCWGVLKSPHSRRGQCVGVASVW
jgi:hypothetical protein